LERAIPEIIAHEKTICIEGKKPKRTFGNVLITSASGKVPMVRAVQDAVRKLHPGIQVIAGDLDEHALTRYLADGFWRMPRLANSEIDELVAGCHQRGIQTIIPTRDGELLFWAQNQWRFLAQGINVVTSPYYSVLTCLDKLAFAQFGLANGLSFIPTSQHPDEIGAGPYVVKERFGAGSRLIGLNLDRRAALQHSKKLENPVYQPFIAGTEISVDAWLDRSYLVKGMVLRTRDKVVDGESQVTTTFRDDAIESLAARVLQTLKLKGPVVMQGLIDPHMVFHVVECNARFGGASTASIAVGLDSLYWSLLETHGVDVDEYPFDRALGEIRQIRIPCDIHLHGNNI
jgi:carbamoyl-phosphate synthase large subunit